MKVNIVVDLPEQIISQIEMVARTARGDLGPYNFAWVRLTLNTDNIVDARRVPEKEAGKHEQAERAPRSDAHGHVPAASDDESAGT